MNDLFNSIKIKDQGPHEFRRSLQRMMIHNGFESFSVDGYADGGGDLLCEKNGETWIIQCKWKNKGLISKEAVNDIIRATYNYNAHKGILATNAALTRNAYQFFAEMVNNSVPLEYWNGSDLLKYSEETPLELEKKNLRPYQKIALHKIVNDNLP